MAITKRGKVASLRTLALLLAIRPATVVAEVPLNLCADFNTADTNRNISIYQTNGLCSDFCRDDYAYAVTQEQSCWCSDYTPDEDTQVNMNRCDIDCPAYPDEKCGGRGLFGYVELNGHLPSGTKGGDDDSASSTTTTEDSTTEAPQTTQIQTITTDGGSIRTITIIPTISNGADGSDGDSDGADSGNGGGGGGLGTGGIVGIVVGVIGAVLIAAGLALFWFLKRRKQNKENGYQDDPSVRGSSSDRMGSGHPEMAVSASSPGSGAHNSNRNSTLQIDPRMDPFKQGLYGRAGSQESINTLRDDHDYSRRILRATNPDPGAET